MDRKKQKCPYCGKRMSYFSAFFSRRKAEYVCTRCGRESKVSISRTIIPVFIIVAAISMLIMGLWIFMRILSNPLGILFVALPLIIFALISPKFVRLDPLRKYQKVMEAKKAGIEYSDNLKAFDDRDDGLSSVESSGSFKINSDLFNQIKAERSSSKEQAESVEISSHSDYIRDIEEDDDLDVKSYVRPIKNVSEEHAQSEAPLKRIHSEGTRVIRRSHYINSNSEDISSLGENEKNEKPAGSRYSGNRRF